jgi:hypothetical protein
MGIFMGLALLVLVVGIYLIARWLGKEGESDPRERPQAAPAEGRNTEENV